MDNWKEAFNEEFEIHFDASELQFVHAFIEENFIPKSRIERKTCEHDSHSHCMEERCYIHEEGGYNQCIDDLLNNKDI